MLMKLLIKVSDINWKEIMTHPDKPNMQKNSRKLLKVTGMTG